MNVNKFNSITPLKKIFIVLMSISLLFHFQCASNRIERTNGNEQIIKEYKPKKNANYMKLHLKNGDVCVLNDWRINKDDKTVEGSGDKFDYNRELTDTGNFIIPIGDIALAESNQLKNSGASSSLTFITFLSGLVSIICITNPKACFGSCPTFYWYDGEDYLIQAEGFSSSISPALEETDIDALYKVKPFNRNLELKLKNEAYETHVIKKANILALKKSEGNRVFATSDNKFYEVNNISNPIQAIDLYGDCSEKLCEFDGVERYSSSDSNNLAAKEIIDLTFEKSGSAEKGLILASRQTIMTTFLFYQTLAYMGTDAGYFLANLERNPELYKNLIDIPRNELGLIEVYVENENGVYDKIGDIGEHGPISTDIKIIPLEKIKTGEEIKIRLKMAKGLWRIDYTALVDIVGEVEPITISPGSTFPVYTESGNKVTDLLTVKDSFLVTLPGEEYYLNYILPEDYKNYELFLESRGYYLEWMREEWYAEENPDKVMQMLFNPKQYYKDLAPQFKMIEAGMEETFWSSKYVLP